MFLGLWSLFGSGSGDSVRYCGARREVWAVLAFGAVYAVLSQSFWAGEKRGVGIQSNSTSVLNNFLTILVYIYGGVA